MPENDAPPGLPIKNASCIFAKLFPQNVDFTTSPLPPSVTLSLAVDTRTHVREIMVRDMATQTNEVIGK
ncbi:hypothetical protein NECAME_15629 [Necator americanus]|uniref:Uncharacterized protein n=1 Tax=Necator americanus TaxID=51031 RepID=W2SJ95_NECAM|nr:hypothetical protein NECAME_15629 [Necator americanus]ETN68797.1 hypothetical protein NECAME_15629 [Necator americanus]